MNELKLIVSLLLLSISTLSAGTIAIVGPCDSEPVAMGAFESETGQTVGDITIAFLKNSSIPFEGTERGINSIFNSPTGVDALEVISDNEMLAYGWCYSLNGFEPASFPHQIQVVQGDEVVWWFGYAHFKNGEWKSQCEPSYQRVPSLICPTK